MTINQQAIIYIVATPIGNRQDLSLRAQEILSNVDFIICEDTRHSSKLLSLFNIKNNLESLHLYNEKEKFIFLIQKIFSAKNKKAAIITDAGTPCISDPGALFISTAHEHGIQIQSVPGPSSPMTALAASGFLQPRSLFSGFLSKSLKEQNQEFELWKQCSPCVAIFFESPKRVLATLKNIHSFFANNVRICVSREMSKLFEEHIKGNPEEVLLNFIKRKEILGEFVLCIDIPFFCPEQKAISLKQASEKSFNLAQEKKIPIKDACKQIANKHNFNAKEIYHYLMNPKDEE